MTRSAKNASVKKKQAFLVAGLALTAIAIPWLLQDPNYRALTGVPLTISKGHGLRAEKAHHLVTLQGDSQRGGLYISQYTFRIFNERRGTARGVRLLMRGIDADGATIFRKLSQPQILEVPAGGSAKAFLRARDLDEAKIARLERIEVSFRGAPPSRPR